MLKAHRRRTRQHLHTAYLHAASSQGINADCVDLDVHHWRVQICDITPGCAIEADLQQLQKTHGYGHIEFGLVFQEDMHPYYPFQLQVSRSLLYMCLCVSVYIYVCICVCDLFLFLHPPLHRRFIIQRGHEHTHRELI